MSTLLAEAVSANLASPSLIRLLLGTSASSPRCIRGSFWEARSQKIPIFRVTSPKETNKAHLNVISAEVKWSTVASDTHRLLTRLQTIAQRVHVHTQKKAHTCTANAHVHIPGQKQHTSLSENLWMEKWFNTLGGQAGLPTLLSKRTGGTDCLSVY